MLRGRETFDFDALGIPTIVEAPKADASKLYAQSLAMVMFELDRAGDGGLPEVVQALHAIDASDPRRRARTLWRTRNPSASPADVRASLAKRIFGETSDRELGDLLDGRFVAPATANQRARCRASEAVDAGAPGDARCKQY